MYKIQFEKFSPKPKMFAKLFIFSLFIPFVETKSLNNNQTESNIYLQAITYKQLDCSGESRTNQCDGQCFNYTGYNNMRVSFYCKILKLLLLKKY